jgi:hypothetical protein
MRDIKRCQSVALRRVIQHMASNFEQLQILEHPGFSLGSYQQNFKGDSFKKCVQLQKKVSDAHNSSTPGLKLAALV